MSIGTKPRVQTEIPPGVRISFLVEYSGEVKDEQFPLMAIALQEIGVKDE
jgi:hypothetical protein